MYFLVCSSGGERGAEAGEHGGGADALEDGGRSGLGSDLHPGPGEGETQHTHTLCIGPIVFS